MRFQFVLIVLSWILAAAPVASVAASPEAEPLAVPIGPVLLDDRDLVHPVIAEHGMVASQQALATAAGVDVLREGGTAIDAAVTVGFVLAVTLPRAGNLGGGGFLLLREGGTGRITAVDYRETAPAAAHRDLFLDENGEADAEASCYSYRATGVPGTVAGLCLVLERYGTIPLQRALAPAIRLAEQGFAVDRALHESLTAAQPRMAASPASLAVFYPGGRAPAVGETLVQADLAWSLRQIAEHGPAAFYRGAIAERLVADQQAHGGLITAADLAAYRPVIREPVRGTYRGYEIVSMPPPSSGGVHLIQMLNLLEPYPIGELGHNSAATIHLLAQCMKRAYADRAVHLGDPDFFDVPTAGLIARAYADSLRRGIDPWYDTPSSRISAGRPPHPESNETTHFSVMDDRGNAVANTYTLNLSYGTKCTAAGRTGILWNNEMDDFSARPGAANAFGLTGGAANAIAPGKRMLSSMTPTLVLKDGRALPGHGQPGRKPHHHDHPAVDHERRRSRHEHRIRHAGGPHPRPVASGRAAHRARPESRHDSPASRPGLSGDRKGRDGRHAERAAAGRDVPGRLGSAPPRRPGRRILTRPDRPAADTRAGAPSGTPAPLHPPDIGLETAPEHLVGHLVVEHDLGALDAVAQVARATVRHHLLQLVVLLVAVPRPGPASPTRCGGSWSSRHRCCPAAGACGCASASARSGPAPAPPCPCAAARRSACTGCCPAPPTGPRCAVPPCSRTGCGSSSCGPRPRR